MLQKSSGMDDRRVYRTRKLLQQAFIELTVEKGFADLTVRDITERAMMNRSTFYRHYLDKYDLLEQYMNEMYALFEDREGVVQLPPHEMQSKLIDLLKHIQEFADFYRVMLNVKDDPLIELRIRQKTEKRILSCFNQVAYEQVGESGAPPIDLIYNVSLTAACGAVVWWLQQEQPYPPEQLAEWLNQLIYGISASGLNLNKDNTLGQSS